MKGFGIAFVVLGAALAALSIRAVADPDSPISSENWINDPWSLGVQVGIGLMLAGIALLVLRRFAPRAANSVVTRLLIAATVGAAGFAAFVPYWGTAQCSEGAQSSGCSVEWWTVWGHHLGTGNSLDPAPYAVAQIVGGCAAVLTAAVLLLLYKRKGSHPVDPGSAVPLPE